ncbi:hypothetical protein FA95DRAFT_1614009 [Auriscalpium vulgare]|uniref:Uncharacterized protein n=1 Tax=Auriscalpium vulgare TaxID=40419 RepID=A0ACB8R212_9AGAM|nr:hypothetical protein FA95DRAFT_1614009 [Auriscalpium vulgare]
MPSSSSSLPAPSSSPPPHVSPMSSGLARTRSGTRAAQKRAQDDRDYNDSDQDDERPTKKPCLFLSAKRKEALRKAARRLPRVVCPWLGIDPHTIIQYGKACSLEGQERDDVMNQYDEDSQRELDFAYQELLKIDDGLRRDIDQNNMADLGDIIHELKIGAQRARSDDTRQVKVHMAAHASPEPGTVIKVPGAAVTDKSTQGFQCVDTARLMCPFDRLAEFDEDPDGMMQKLQDGTVKATHEEPPSFLYDPAKVNIQEHPLSGLFQGFYLIRTWKLMFLASKSVYSTKAKSRPNNATLCGMTSVTERSIAYAAVQARFALSSQPTWTEKDDKFNFKAFFHHLLDFLKLDPEWTKTLLASWNELIFGDKHGLAKDPDDSEDADKPKDNALTRAKAQLAARKKAAEDARKAAEDADREESAPPMEFEDERSAPDAEPQTPVPSRRLSPALTPLPPSPPDELLINDADIPHHAEPDIVACNTRHRAASPPQEYPGSCWQQHHRTEAGEGSAEAKGCAEAEGSAEAEGCD